MLNGCDISNFQGRPDFSQLKPTVEFIFTKASEGTGYTDPTFINNQSQLRNLNILRGYYHFARPDLGNSPEAEAKWFLKVVGKLQDGEILALDFEVNYTDRVNWCRKFLDHLSFLLGGYKPLIYLNLNLVNTNDWSSVINEGYGLWLADYDNSQAPINTSWPVLAFKQYSSTGKLTGISGNVDLDVFYGDINSFIAYGYKTAVNPTLVNPITQQLDQDHLNGVKVLDDYRKVRLDGSEGNFEGLCRVMVDRDSKYSSLAGKFSILQDQINTATITINDLTQKLLEAQKKAPTVLSNVGNPPIGKDVNQPALITKEVDYKFKSHISQFIYDLLKKID